MVNNVDSLQLNNDIKDNSLSPRSDNEIFDDDNFDNSLIQVRPIFSSIEKDKNENSGFKSIILSNKRKPKNSNDVKEKEDWMVNSVMTSKDSSFIFQRK